MRRPGCAHRVGVAAHLAQRLAGHTIAIAPQQLGRDAGEEVGRHGHLAQALELRDLAQHAVQADAAGVGLEVQERHLRGRAMVPAAVRGRVGVVVAREQGVDGRQGVRR